MVLALWIKAASLYYAFAKAKLSKLPLPFL